MTGWVARSRFGRVTYAPGVSRRGRPADRGTSTPRPPSRCTRRRARPCWPRWTRGTPIPAACTEPPATRGCCSTTPARWSPTALGVRPDEVTFTSSRHATPCTAACSASRGPGPRTDRRSSTPPSSTPPCCTPSAGAASRGRSACPGRPGRAGRPRRRSSDGLRRRRRRPWPPCSPPTTRSAPSSRSRGSRRASATYPSSWTPAPRWAGSPLPDGWSAAAGSAHKWGGPAGVGVLLVRKGARWRNPFPGDDRVDERGTGFENVPAALAAAAALQAVVDERDEVDARQHALVDRIRERPWPRIPDVEVVGDPDRPAPPPGDVLLPVRRRRGAGDRARPARVRRRQRARRAPRRPSTPSHVLEAMGVLTHGNVRVSLHPRHHRRTQVDGFLDVAARAWSPASAPEVGTCRERRPRARLPRDELPAAGHRARPGTSADVEVGGAARRGRRRPRRRAPTSRPGAGCAGQEYVGEEPADDGTPRYMVAGSPPPTGSATWPRDAVPDGLNQRTLRA